MCLWYSVYFLIAGLYLSSSAPTPEECERLVTPLPLDPTKLHDRWNFIAGFTDHEMFVSILKTIGSSWFTFTPSPFSNDTLIMDEENMMDGKCNSSSGTVTILDNTASVAHDHNMNSTFQLLPSCSDCLTFSINTTVPQLDFPIHSFYLAARSGAVEESDLKTFQQQAECLKFSSPMNFHYDPKTGFCPPAPKVQSESE